MPHGRDRRNWAGITPGSFCERAETCALEKDLEGMERGEKVELGKRAGAKVLNRHCSLSSSSYHSQQAKCNTPKVKVNSYCLCWTSPLPHTPWIHFLPLSRSTSLVASLLPHFVWQVTPSLGVLLLWSCCPQNYMGSLLIMLPSVYPHHRHGIPCPRGP